MKPGRNKKMVFTWVIFFSLLVVQPCRCASSQLAGIATVRSYDNPNFIGPKTNFTVEQTIYLYVLLQQLVPGKHHLVIDWIDPAGKVQEQTQEDFAVGRAGIFQRMFAMRLNKSGRFTQMVTGISYPDRFYGKWTCGLFLDGVRIDEYQMKIQ
jgi:hypothetical protein